MSQDDRHQGSVAEESPRSHLFMVRVWTGASGGEAVRRGSVRAADSGAYRHFLEWADLVDFLDEETSTRSPAARPLTSHHPAGLPHLEGARTAEEAVT